MEGFDYGAVDYRNGHQPTKNVILFEEILEKNEKRSTEMGMPQFDSRLFIKIVAPGSKDEHVTPFIEDRFRKRPDWPDVEAAYIRYKSAKEGKPILHGYPIEEWPPISRSMAAEFRYHNIYTVEDIAGVSDSNMKILGLYGRKLRDQACDFLKKAAGEAPLLELRAKFEQLEERCKYLEDQNKALVSTQGTAPSILQFDVAAITQAAVQAALAAVASKPEKKMGRPKKILNSADIPNYEE